jgi:hypothetical protein
MNVYELFGLVLVLGMVVALLVAAHALGEGERVLRRAEQDAERKAAKTAGQAEDRENSEV